MTFVPNVGDVCRFPSGIRVVLSEPQHGKVMVAQPKIRFTPSGDCVLLREDNTVFAYPGVAFLDVNAINRRYDMVVGELDDDGEIWMFLSPVTLKTPVKKKRKPRKK